MNLTARSRFIYLVTCGYLFFGLLWITLSDRTLAAVPGLEAIAWLPTAKGVFVLLATATALFLALQTVPGIAPTIDRTSEIDETKVLGKAPSRLIYAFAIGVTLAAFIIRQLLADSFGEQSLLILFTLPIVLSAVLGGIGPGLLATALAALGTPYWALPPLNSMAINSPADVFQWLVMIASGVIVSIVTGEVRRSTARTQMDRALLQSVIMSTTDAIAVKDVQGRYLIANRAVAEIVGRPVEDILGQDATSLIGAAEAASVTASDHEVVSRRKADSFEHWVHTATQGQRLFQSSRSPVVLVDGTVLGVCSIARDITEMRRAELAIAESETRLRLALEAIRDGVWDWDLRTDRIFRSPRYYELVGGSAADDDGHAFPFLESLVLPDDWSGITAAMATHCDGSTEQIDVEFRLRDPSQAGRWLAARGRAVELDRAGKPLRIIGTISEVTDRRQAGERLEALVVERTRELARARDALAASERFVRSIADAVPGMVGYWDNDLRCRFGNAAYLTWFGRTPEQMLGIRMMDLFGEELYRLNEPYIHAALRGERQRFQRTLTRTDGSVGYTLTDYIPDIVDGQVRGFDCVVTDVSELKKVEFELEQLNAQLVQRAAEAEAATRAKSVFLANMSHEIRTPLNAVIGLNHLMARDATDALQIDRLNKVHDAAHHLLQVINDILDLSKIEAGRLTLESTDFELDEVLDRAASFVQSRAAEKGLEVIMESDHLPSRLCGDPTRLLQILVNLLGNAVKFTSDGWVRMRGKLTHDDGQILSVRFEVQEALVHGYGCRPVG